MIKTIENPDPDSKRSASRQVSSGFESVVREHLERLLKGIGNQGGDHLYKMIMEMVERLLLDLTMRQCQENQVEAARILGINRNTLSRRLKELNIKGKGKRGRKRKIRG